MWARVALMDVDASAPREIARLAALLDDDERARAQRLRAAHDRAAYIAAHALLRAMLSAQCDVAPPDWRFAAGEHGKPFLVNGPAQSPRFSLSHTRGVAAVAIGEGADIGVDVEAQRAETRSSTARDDLALARRFFAPEEIACLEARTGEERRDAFLALWTLKEAVIKATGQGLSAPLDGFSLRLDPPRIAGDDGWSLARLRRAGKCGVAHVACAARAASVRIDFVETSAAAIHALRI